MGKFLKWLAGLTAGAMLAYGVATSYSFAKTPDGFSMTSKKKPDRTIVYDVKNMKIDYNDKFKSARNDLDTLVSYDIRNKMLGTNFKDNVRAIDSKIDYDVSKRAAVVNVNIPKYSIFSTLEKDNKYKSIMNKYIKDAAVYTPYGNFYHTR